jgi:biotin operon repressor
MLLRNGISVDEWMLDRMERDGMSEEKIAGVLGISRMGLWKVRKRLNCPQKTRSDKGKKRD